MSDVVKAVILGIIEGLTEFLPVSSTGHMVLAMPWLGIDAEVEPWKAFLYFIQIGAILAVLIYFFRALWKQTFRPTSNGWKSHVITKVVVGAIPGGVAGVLLNDFMDEHLEWAVPVACALIVGGVAMWWIEKKYRRTEGPGIEQMTLRQAFIIGVAQCLAIIPGTSRSMATIMAGLMVGLPASTAAEFSFYLAIPILFGAGLLRVVKHPESMMSENLTIMMVGFVVSFIVAWIAVAGFMNYIRRRSLAPFALYRVVLGAVVLVLYFANR